MFKSLAIALLASSAALAASVEFLPPSTNGSFITQVYAPLTSNTRYYSTAAESQGSPLMVNSVAADPPPTTTIGTLFQFVPVNSVFMGYPQNSTHQYGHVVLASNSSLHLTVDRPAAAEGLTPYLSAAVTTDDNAQLTQFWAYDTQSKFLAFLGIRQTAPDPSWTGPYGPVFPSSASEKLVLVNMRNTVGKFYLGRPIY